MGLDACGGWVMADCWAVCGFEWRGGIACLVAGLTSGMSGMSRTGRGRGRARAEVAVVRVLEKRLGALPGVAQFGRRVRVAEVVDGPCPVRPVGWISDGAGIDAVVA